jgi:hypothetical protein
MTTVGGMRWLLGGLLLGALVTGGLLWRQEHRPRACGGGIVVVLPDGAPDGSDEGQRDPDVAAGLALDDRSDVERDPDPVTADDDRVTYYSYGGDRSLDEVVVVHRDDDLWYAGRYTDCG